MLLSLMGERSCFCLLLRMATNRILTPWVCETESNGVFFYIYNNNNIYERDDDDGFSF